MDPHKAKGVKPEGDNRERGDGGAKRRGPGTAPAQGL